MSDEFIIKSDGYPHIDKDPGAKLPYTWDWTVWLANMGSASIDDATITATGLTVHGVAQINGGLVSQVISGGTAGTSYPVTCRVQTNDGLIDDRTIVIDVKER
mgnify:CR=1 FL=1